MKKLVIGKPQITHTVYKGEKPEVIAVPYTGDIPEVINLPYVHVPETLERETVIVETRVVEKISTKDKLARRHSRLSARKMEKLVEELMETLNQQNERIHYLSNQKPTEIVKEIQVVTEKTIVEKHIPRKLVYALLASLVLNGLIFLLK